MQKIGLEAILDMADFNKGLKDYTTGVGDMEATTETATKRFDGVGKALGTVAKVGIGAAVAGFGALAGVIGTSVAAASEAQAIEAQLDQVLRSTGGAAGMTKDEILNLANALSQTTPYEDDLIVATETILLQFKNISEDVFPQATLMTLDLAQRLGIDAPAAAKLLGKALEEPGEGLARLRQAGVAFTDEQEAMIKSMVEAGDSAGAQKFIMDQLATSVGGAATAAGQTYAGQLEILKNKFGNLQESIGAAFLPVFESLVSKFSEFVTAHGPAIEAAFQALATWIGDNLPIAVAALADFWTNTLQPALSIVWAFIRDSLIPILSDVWTWLATNIPPVIAALAELWTTTLQPALTAVWSFIQDSLIPILADVWDWLSTTLPPVIQTMADLWENVLKPALEAVWGFIQDPLMPIISALAEVIGAVLGKAFEVVAGLWENILKPALNELWGFIRDNVMPIVQALIVDGLGKLEEAFEGIKKAIKPVVDFLKDLADGIKDLELPDWLTPGSATPFEKALTAIAKILDKALTDALAKFTNEMAQSAKIWNMLVDTLRDQLTNLYQVVFPALTSAFITLGSTAVIQLNSIVTAATAMAAALNSISTTTLPALRAAFDAAFGGEGGITDLVTRAAQAIQGMTDNLGLALDAVNQLPAAFRLFQTDAVAAITAVNNAIGTTTTGLIGRLNTVDDNLETLRSAWWNAFTGGTNSMRAAVVAVVDAIGTAGDPGTLMNRLNALEGEIDTTRYYWWQAWVGDSDSIANAVITVNALLQETIDLLNAIVPPAQAAGDYLQTLIGGRQARSLALAPVAAGGNNITLTMNNTITSGLDLGVFESRVLNVVKRALQYG